VENPGAVGIKLQYVPFWNILLPMARCMKKYCNMDDSIGTYHDLPMNLSI
jgi:hypothetical protein